MYPTQIQGFTIFKMYAIKLAHGFAALHLQQDRKKTNC
jgi:hypothetical protein